MTALMLWLPVLIAKLFKGIWTLCRFLLSAVCGVPLYYSRPGHRILGQLIGFFGLIFTGTGVLSLLFLVFDRNYAAHSAFGGTGEILRSSLISLAVGAASLLACRAIIRRGALG